MEPLTERQRATFDFIREYRRRHGFSPTVREIAKSQGVVVNATMEMIDRLLEKGWLVATKGTARSLIPADEERRRYDLHDHLDRQWEHAQRAFGPRVDVARNIAHIRKELREIEHEPDSLEEWMDVALLAFDGALRASGGDVGAVVSALDGKLEKNRARRWPDWRTVPPGAPIHHLKSEADPEA